MQTEQRARELQKMNIKVQLVMIGKKGITYFKRRQDKYKLAGTVPASYHHEPRAQHHSRLRWADGRDLAPDMSLEIQYNRSSTTLSLPCTKAPSWPSKGAPYHATCDNQSAKLECVQAAIGACNGSIKQPARQTCTVHFLGQACCAPASAVTTLLVHSSSPAPAACLLRPCSI